jgi:hypothetical protein
LAHAFWNRGYIGDHCRMGIIGEPDAELRELLQQIEEIQQAARAQVTCTHEFDMSAWHRNPTWERPSFYAAMREKWRSHDLRCRFFLVVGELLDAVSQS